MANNNVPQIGVLLKANGLSDVIAAFTAAGAAGEAAGAEMAEGFAVAATAAAALDAAVGLLEGALVALAAALPALAIGAAVAGLTEMVAKSEASAAAIGKLSQETGGSVEKLSVLAMVAGDLGVDTDTLSSAFVKLGKSQQDAAAGGAKQLTAFKALGISVQDLQTLDPASLFIKMSTAANSAVDGPQKLNAALALMGKGARDLILVMDRLGEETFQAATEKAQKLGLILDQDTVNACRAAQEGFRELGDIVDGLSRRFTAGFAPYMVAGVEAIAEAVEGRGVDSMKTFGDYTGRVMQFILGHTMEVAHAIEAALKNTWASATYYVKQATLAAKGFKAGGVSGAYGALQSDESFQNGANLDATLQQNAQDYDKNIAADKAYLNTPPTVRKYKTHPGGGTAEGDGTTQEQKDKVGDARAKYLMAADENALSILKASNAEREQEDKRSYDAGMLTLTQYYDNRAARIKQELDAELALLEKQREAALHVNSKDDADKKETDLKAKVANNTASPDEYKELEDAAKAETAATEAVDAAQSKAAQNESERAAATHELSMKELEDTKKLQEASGDKFGAEETGLQEDILKYKELLKNVENLTQAEKDAKVQEFSDKGEARIEFQRQDQKGTQGLQSMNQDIADVQQQASNGTIDQVTAATQILAIERQRLPVLMQIAQAELSAAQKDGNDEDIAKAKQYIETLKGIKSGLQDATTAQTYLYNQLETQGIQAMEGFFTSWLDGSKSFTDSLKDLGKAFEEMIAQMIAKMILLYTIELLVGWITGGDEDAIANVTKLMGLGSHQAGGFTKSGRDDQVAGIVHSNEWVATSAQTKEYGGLFSAISSGMHLPATASPSTPFASVGSTAAAATVANANSAPASSNAAHPMVQVITPPGASVQQKQVPSAGGGSITQLIISAVHTDIASGGNIAKQMETQYGLARGGVKRGG